jgi:hypothetical protein
LSSGGIPLGNLLHLHDGPRDLVHAASLLLAAVVNPDFSPHYGKKPLFMA